MTDKELTEKLEAWSIATGNYIFHRDLLLYVKVVSKDNFKEILIARSLQED